MNTIHLTTIIPAEQANKRLDQVLAELYPEYSRTRIKQWILKAQVLLNDKIVEPRTKVKGGETLVITAELESEQSWQAESIDLTIIYEDDSVLVINKPAGLVVHPGAGNWEGTLVNALLHHDPSLATLPRAGVVHRIDKDTSGLLVIAKTLAAHTSLVAQIQKRSVKREYHAVVCGKVIAGKTVDLPIGRHPIHRKRMAVSQSGRSAITHFRVLERFRAHSHIKVQLETGRTHQIRVHMAAINYPIVGDSVYGGRFKIPPNASNELIETLRQFKRQALHAAELSFTHPKTHEEMHFIAPLPEDMQHLLSMLKKDMQYG